MTRRPYLPGLCCPTMQRAMSAPCPRTSSGTCSPTLLPVGSPEETPHLASAMRASLPQTNA